MGNSAGATPPTAQPTASWFLDTERKAHAAAAASRCVAYVERPEQIEHLDAFADAVNGAVASNLLIVHGESGSGKSSLLSYWSARRSANRPSAFLVAHYVGATGSSVDHVEIIRRLVMEIRERYAIREEMPTGRDRVEEEFPRWLGHVQSEDLCFVLDGLDQLDPRSRDLAWLPEYLQPRVRVIVSSKDDRQVEQVIERGAEMLRIQPLSRSDRVEIARRHIESRSTGLTHALIRRVTSAPASANPLFLRTSLEEVRAHAHSEGVEERIEYYLAADGLEDLYGRMLHRIERDHGSELVGDVLGLVLASRRGLSGHELGEVTGRPDAVHALLKRLEFFLIRRNDLVSLLHQELRNAVIERYATDDAAEHRMHARLADFFAVSGDSRRAVDELVWHLARSGDRERLARQISDLSTFYTLYTIDEGLELLGYVLELGDGFDAGAVYARAFEELADREANHEKLALVGNALGAFLQLGGYVAHAIDVLSALLTRLEACDGTGIHAARTLMRRGNARQMRGDLTGAERDVAAALEIVDLLPLPSPEDLVRTRSALAGLLYARAEYPRAARILTQALAIAEQEFGRQHAITTDVMVDLGAVVAAEDCRRGEEILWEAFAVCEEVAGPGHPRTAQVLNNLASVLSAQRRRPEALALLQRAAEINRRALGPASGELAANLANMGLLKKWLGDIEGAESEYSAALGIFEATGRDQSVEAATILMNLGWMNYSLGRSEASRAFLRRSFELRLKNYGESHTDTLYVARCLMLLEWSVGDYSKAEEWCTWRDDALSRKYGADHPGLEQTTRDREGIVSRSPVPKYLEENEESGAK